MKNLQIIPDINFRNELKQLFYKAFEEDMLDVNNNEIIKCKGLNVSALKIKDLTGIEWFVNLKMLDCTYNQLRTLPNLPNALKELHCYNNSLTSLSKLPDRLKDLFCDNNNLTSLPELPGTLKDLYCSNNPLRSLPTLPKTLKNWIVILTI